ncbi:hypothetical protein SUGI_0636630 [Cryptomeria japonica]|nr:hypothetical protein SUGI_0636560 [Cryptomeria japonica]GLJ31682.1 hypothetical protein SUGI_0636630 [Cryptomeria japonica]
MEECLFSYKFTQPSLLHVTPIFVAKHYSFPLNFRLISICKVSINFSKMGVFRFVQSCFKLPAANDVFPEEDGKQDDNAKKMKDSSEKKKGSSCSAPIVVSYFPVGSNLSRL